MYRWVLGVVCAVLLAGCGAANGATTTVDAEVDSGYIPDGERISPFDDGDPAIDRLDPALLSAVRSAATDARARGVGVGVTSGWRSRELQQQLLDQAVAKYGSLDAARQYVSTPDVSKHVTGDAIDIGPTDAADWLIQHGDEYGLCQMYSNEMWHFELATEPGGTCPAPLPNAAG